MFLVSYCAPQKANFQSFKYVKHSTISSVKDIYWVSNIFLDNENADSEEIIKTGTLSTSQTKMDKFENSDWLSFYYFKISSETCDNATNLDPKYLSTSSV